MYKVHQRPTELSGLLNTATQQQHYAASNDGEHSEMLSLQQQQQQAKQSLPMSPAFVQLHNVTSSIYDTFKEDAQALLSQNASVSQQQQIVARISHNCERLLQAMEAEKRFLMSDMLCQWAVQQQKLSVGSLWTQQQNYTLLDAIDVQFEYFGELLEQTLSGLEYLSAELPANGFQELYERVRAIAHLFLYYSVIVSRQPPAVIVKCGEAENHRRSRFWFSTEIRLLGGRAFGLLDTANGASLQCYLITDETAKQLRIDAYHPVCDHEEFVVEPASSTFKTGSSSPVTVTNGSGGENDDNHHHSNFRSLGTPSPCSEGAAGQQQQMLAAKFEDMRIAKKEHLRRDSVLLKRYHLCYDVRLTTARHSIELIGRKVSLPFAILVGPKADVEARLFLERSFADFVRRPDGALPELVHCQALADALELKFQAILETPQKPTEQPTPVQPRPFSLHSKQHLVSRLRPDASGQIAIENFLKMAVAEDFQVPKKGGGGVGAATGGSNNHTNNASPSSVVGTPATVGGKSSSPFSNKQQQQQLMLSEEETCGGAGNGGGGEWKLIPFYEWFFKTAELVNKHFLTLWNDNLIYGFCGKDEAEGLLAECSAPTLLIRFSDIDFGKVKISVRDAYGAVRHHWYDQSELQGRSLTHELLTNAKYRGVFCIYPNISLEWAIGSRESQLLSAITAQRRKPRHLQPSPLYFDNQDHGPSSF